MSTRTPQRSTAPSRTARPIPGTGRPLKIDLTDLAGGSSAGRRSAFSNEPLAQWDAPAALGESRFNSGGGGGAPTQSLPLSDMVDRASAQVMILRKTIEEASAADRAVRQHASELAQRLAQGHSFATDFDQRLARAGQAANVVEKAAVALAALDTVVKQIRGAQDVILKDFDAKLARQREVMEATLSRQESAMEARLAQQENTMEEQLLRQQDVFERRIQLLAETYENAMVGVERSALSTREESERIIAESRRELMQQVENVCAGADRHVAQAQARASLITDSVADRVDVLQQQCNRIGTDAQEYLDAICAKGAALLGHDPRSDFSSQPRAGSLAEAAARAQTLISGVDEASIRIAAVRNDAETTLKCLLDVSEEARRTTSEHQPRLETLRQTIEQAIDQGRQMQHSLEEAMHGQADAADKSAQASMLLSRQREDLQMIAQAGQYHVEQCRSAEAALKATIEAASGRSAELKKTMEDIGGQAESMVALAREAAGLVVQAKMQKAAEEKPSK